MGARGALRIYLGAAPGVGKTYKMLGEAVRRKSRGTDVVIGLVETHGRPETACQLGDLELMPLKEIDYRGAVLREMDLDAILARRPQVVLVDEYAHTNAPGSKSEKRWQDVEELLEAGIDVISTLNIQHLESLNDVILRITGTAQRETVPDDVVRRADQLELVDMTSEAIRRRMAHGNIYPPERIDAALANYFRPGNLDALRELALLWVADRVEESLHSYLEAHAISSTWETRERVVVGITGVPGGDALIRRAARMAGRVGGDFVGVHIAVDDGLTRDDPESLSAQRRLVEQLGGKVHEVVGHDTAESLAAFASREKATQLVLGATRRSRWHELFHGSFIARVTRLAGDVDVHVIAQHSQSQAAPASSRRAAPSLDRRRVIAAWLVMVLGLPLLIAATVPFRSDIALSTELLLALSLVLAIATIGGKVVATAAAILASLLVNWYYVQPYNTLTISEAGNVVALVVFIGVAVTVGTLVDVASKRAVEARRARLEAEALARSTTSLAADPEPLPGLLDQLHSTFDLTGVKIVRIEGDRVVTVASAGHVVGSPTGSIALASSAQGVNGSHSTLQLFGRTLSIDDLRLLRVLADQLAVALDNRRLMVEASAAATLADIDIARTALLRAVSHDLRTPLASIKAMVSGLRDPAVKWTEGQLAEALETVDQETDRLNRLVGNLLDASRLQIGALAVAIRPTVLNDTVNAALQSLSVERDDVRVDIAPEAAAVMSDPALLERSVANVISNAIRHSPPQHPVRIEAGTVGDSVHLRVVDRGPGIPVADRARVTTPFQRLGDQRTNDDGVGLGLSIAEGFVEAMHGTLTLDDTPGGGLTVTITLPRAAEFSVEGT
ncbi:MAG: two-component system, OmpR family, sensor histidine kinase KdpD [Ilumatobacteraceae bacterium]